jgi:hypothetical protein
MVGAIEIYNKPRFAHRYECAVILLVNAWELLFKTTLSKNRISIYYPSDRARIDRDDADNPRMVACSYDERDVRTNGHAGEGHIGQVELLEEPFHVSDEEVRVIWTLGDIGVPMAG